MKFTRLIFAALLIAASFLSVQAQDTIIKKNGDVIKAKITEIGIDEVKFKVFGETDGPVIILKKGEIRTAKVAGQTIIDVKGDNENVAEDIIVKKTGDLLKVKVIDIGIDEVKFKLQNDPYGPTISIAKTDIKTMKVGGQTVIDVKGGLGEDMIAKKDGSSLKVKVIEMGTDEVKFKLHNNPDGPTMTLKKKEIQTVKIDGQVVYEYKEDPRSISNNAILNKTSVVKFYFFSPLNNHLALGYEWMVRPGFNWDISGGIIGPGTSLRDAMYNRPAKYHGGFIRFGPKFLLGSSSDVEVEGVRIAHPLKGRFFKLDVILNTMSSTQFVDTGYYYNMGEFQYKNKYQSMTLILGYGRQLIIGNTITVGAYAGVGYSFENKTSNLPKGVNINWYDEWQPNRYSHTFFGENFPLSTSVRFTIGYIMKTPSWLASKKSVGTKPPTRNSMGE